MSYLNGQIIVVDGDKDTSALIKVFLKSQGYTVATASPEEKAIDSIPHNDIALYIINEKYPDSFTTELCRKIRAVDYVAPILICSPSDHQSYIEKVRQAGADDYITTPQDWIKLIDRMRSLIDHYLRNKRSDNAMTEATA